MDKVSKKESDKLDKLLAEFFYACNVPFHAVDSEYFTKFIGALRPAYKPPNRQKLGEQLLENEHAKMIEQNEALVPRMDKQASLLVDGRTNSNANRHYFVCEIVKNSSIHVSAGALILQLVVHS